MDFHVRVLSRDSFDVWRLADGAEAPKPGDEPQGTVRRIAASGYWIGNVVRNGQTKAVKSAKSRGGCLLATLEHLGGF